MGLIELLLVAVGLSMDAFAVSVCKGLNTKKRPLKTGIVAGLYFGGFQAFIATTVLVGGALLADSKITLLTFFAFMILVSRVYDPLIAALDNLSAIIMIRNIQCRRMGKILSHPEQ